MHSLLLLINKVLEKLLIFIMATIVITVTWQVFSRFILQSPSSFTEELARFLLIWIGILGAAYAYRTKAHLGLDLFVEKMQPVRQKVARIFIEVVVMAFAGSVMVYGGLSLVMLAVELKQTSATLGLNMGLVYSVIPISGVLILLYGLDNLIQLNSSTAVEV
ncbi:TRAP transporter small permease [Alteromonadaceae bacterium BrNp21-10]|nr:TRAP transporter small permease [Alteromonadaceae bacterium BrNp21-10]